ncbi:MAG: hypothetical protein IH948_09850, partial [Bacteroidetes bacterium]|nr:hypothetical protein [Bacteroidota bacterium]
GYEISKKLKISQKTIFYKYEMNNVTVAWHKPMLDLSLIAEYKLKDKLKVKVEFYMMDGLKARSYNSGEETRIDLPTFYDVNLSMEYNYSSRLSAFLLLNNLASKSYQRWYQYPRYNFNILGGFSFSF